MKSRYCCSVRDRADHLAEVVDALADDTGSRSIATGGMSSWKPRESLPQTHTRVSEADNDPRH